MKATEAKLLDFLKKSQQFIIPIYQRTYTWTESECQQLWDDIMRTGKDDEISAHFIGSIVYIEKGIYQISSQNPLLVIDGQQRLTTVSLILEALARHLDTQEPVEGFSQKKLRQYYLLNPLESDEKKYKLILTQTDKDTFLSILEERKYPNDYSLRIKENFDFFSQRIEDLDNLISLCKGLAKLIIVDIALNKAQDNPQLIFESMNSTGRELSQADLIRNFILMDLEPENQTRLYMDYWRPMELAFGQEAYNQHFDSFMRHFLTVKTDKIPKIDDVYSSFKMYANTPRIKQNGIESLVKEVAIFAEYYCAMALGQETHSTLKQYFNDLRELNVDVYYPLLLELYHDYKNDLLSLDDFCEVIRLIESYIFRRAVCSIPTNSTNRMFANFKKYLDKDNYFESIKAHFLLLPSYRRFPNDEEFKQEFKIRDLYNFRHKTYWLRRFENFNRKERVSVDEYTIEHIMPQNAMNSPQWRKELGQDYKRIHDTYLHTSGNLTLTGYNSEYSDRSFLEKRDIQGGFKESPLRVNEGLGTLDSWNENTILSRADKLSQRAIDIWVSPELSEERLEKYREEKKASPVYTLEQHPALVRGQNKHGDHIPILFEKLRKEILSIDPCVNEEILKLYIAYKAETNFVDIIPRLKYLQLSLNIKFIDLNDPKEIARDVTGMGRWGNGDVEIILSDINQVPYVIGLIKQAFEKQMYSDDET